jgi:hypothetical protein
MIDAWVHEIAHQRHQDLLAAAERDRLGRSVQDPNMHRRTVSYRLNSTPLGFAVSRFRHAFRHS